MWQLEAGLHSMTKIRMTSFTLQIVQTSDKEHVYCCCLSFFAIVIMNLTLLQAIKQMYVLVLGLDVLGNPFGILRGLATGIEDLFYEPYQGAIQGPEEFAEGLALGVRSLLGHAVGKISLLEGG